MRSIIIIHAHGRRQEIADYRSACLHDVGPVGSFVVAVREKHAVIIMRLQGDFNVALEMTSTPRHLLLVPVCSAVS